MKLTLTFVRMFDEGARDEKTRLRRGQVVTDRRAHRLRHGRGFLLLDVILGPGFAEERSLEVARRIALILGLPLHRRRRHK